MKLPGHKIFTTNQNCHYAHIEDRIEPEKYLAMNLNKYKRSLLCQLRCGILPLEIEVAHYHKIPRRERICKLCKGVPETELHFLFDCYIKRQTYESVLQMPRNTAVP